MAMNNCCDGAEMFDLCGPRFGISKDKLKDFIKEVCGERPNGGGNDGNGPNFSYSYNEKWTGRLWYDGKKVYQKTFKITNNLAANATVSIAHNIANLEQLVDQYSVARESGNYFDPMPYVGSTANYYISIVIKSKTMEFKSFNGNRQGPHYVTLLYTCSDR